MFELIFSAVIALWLTGLAFILGKAINAIGGLKGLINENNKVKNGRDKFNNFNNADKSKWLFRLLEKRKNNK